MTDVNNLLGAINGISSFRRVDASHPLNLYVGMNELSRWTMLLICDQELKGLFSSKLIQVENLQRKDGLWAVSFSLLKDDYKDLFLRFCEDIIESSRVFSNPEKGARFIVKRYGEWRNMLAKASNEMSPEAIKGLLGELYVLGYTLIPTFGVEKAVMSWIGPRKGHQDFVLDNTWIEVKTIPSSSREVEISSVEQLDCPNEGSLIVVYADHTSKTNTSSTNINRLFREISEKLLDDDLRIEFSNTLFRNGYYPKSEYESVDYTFEVKAVESYAVNKNFPCLRKENIPVSITKASYYISIPAIAPFKTKKGTDNGPQ